MDILTCHKFLHGCLVKLFQQPFLQSVVFRFQFFSAFSQREKEAIVRALSVCPSVPLLLLQFKLFRCGFFLIRCGTASRPERQEIFWISHFLPELRQLAVTHVLQIFDISVSYEPNCMKFKMGIISPYYTQFQKLSLIASTFTAPFWHLEYLWTELHENQNGHSFSHIIRNGNIWV